MGGGGGIGMTHVIRLEQADVLLVVDDGQELRQVGVVLFQFGNQFANVTDLKYFF